MLIYKILSTYAIWFSIILYVRVFVTFQIEPIQTTLKVCEIVKHQDLQY